ncbi:hypothetical protein [Emticicia sp. 17c]|uniref:hypothetical protein n=1 Tax=Emticicia sp. 17c TaxID=3127704 RepID=UPI00301D9014
MQKILIAGTLFLGAILTFFRAEAQKKDELYTKKYSYQHLSAYQKKLFNTFIENEVPQNKGVEAALTDNISLRSMTRVAQSLLFRNANGDKENAVVILEWILKNQYQDETSKLYGIWKTSVANDRFDQNWREFIGCDLIIIRERFRHLLPSSLVKNIDAGLIHAAKGALARNVGADYTNISIMSAFLMEYVGTTFGLESLKKAGIAKAHEIFNLYKSHKTFSEYNSPTYYGVTLIGLALWRELAPSKEIQTIGGNLEKEFWHEIANLYNPDLKNIPGPHFRGYGMDMTRYFAITGIWIALALDDEHLSPLPPANAPKYGEVSNLSTILNLGLSIPKDDLKALKSFSKPHSIIRNVPNKYKGDSIKLATTVINKDWMMGGLWGNKRVWEQIKAGTIHWKATNGEVAWLAILGDGNTNVKVSQQAMFIYTSSAVAYQLEILVYSPETDEKVFAKQDWTLSGMKLHTRTTLKLIKTEKINHQDADKKYAIADDIPFFYKVVYEVPANWNLNQPLLEITPEK